MPRRIVPLVNGNFYHVYNHGIDHKDTFTDKREYQRFQLTAWFYQPKITPFRLSQYLKFNNEMQLAAKKDINEREKAVLVHAYVQMNNHYHFVLEQVDDNGISTFIGNLQNSYTKYFNAKHERKGPLFLSAFRAKQIFTDEQFLHVTRYVHLNPYTAHFIPALDKLTDYPYSSLPEYFSEATLYPLTTTEYLMSFFTSKQDHLSFIQNQADYQRQLAHISHILD